MAAEKIFECGNQTKVCKPIYMADDVCIDIHFEAMTEAGGTLKLRYHHNILPIHQIFSNTS